MMSMRFVILLSALVFCSNLGPVCAQIPTVPKPNDDATATPEDSSEPAVPSRYASPAASMSAFLQAMQRLEEDPSNKEQWDRVFDTLDMPAAVGDARKEAAWQLFGVLEGLGKGYPSLMFPSSVKLEAEGIESVEFFPNNMSVSARMLFQSALKELGEPPGRIEMVRKSDGTWRFSADTLDNTGRLFSWIKPLESERVAEVTRFSSVAMLRRFVPNWLMGQSFLDLEAWQWIGLVVLLFFVGLLHIAFQYVMRPLTRMLVQRFVDEPNAESVRMFAKATALLIAAVAFRKLMIPLGITGNVLATISVAVAIIIAVAIIWSAWTAIDLFIGAWQARVAGRAQRKDDVLLPLVSKISKTLVVACGLVYLADSLDFVKFLTPLFAGFGVAGLAVSFAAQDMVKNLFGGLTIFLDRPFRVGERILFQQYDGVVQEIGFRSTKVRTLTGNVVTIPNGTLTNEPVENIGKRPNIRRQFNVTITYDTPREKIEEAVQIIQGLFEEDGLRERIHSMVKGEVLSPRAFFNDMLADSLCIQVTYWFAPPDWWSYMEHAQRFNLRLFEEFEQAGIEFAFPTQTLYLAGDTKRELAVKMLGNDVS